MSDPAFVLKPREKRSEDEERRGGAGPLLVRGAGPARAGRLWADLERVAGIRFSSTMARSLGEFATALKSPGVVAALALSAGLAVSVLTDGGPVAPLSSEAPGFRSTSSPPLEDSALAGDAIALLRGANSSPLPDAASAPPAAEAGGPVDGGADRGKKTAEGTTQGSAPGAEAEGSSAPGVRPADAPALISRLGADSGSRFSLGTSPAGSAAAAGTAPPAGTAKGAADAARPAAGRSYAARTTDPRSTRSLSTARGGGRSGMTGKNAFGQLRFADGRSRFAAAAGPETSRYQAAQAFDGNAGSGVIGGTGAGSGTGGTGTSASPAPSEPIRSPAPAPQPAPVTNGKNKTSYQQQMRMAIGLLAVSAILIAIAAMLRMAADSNPLAAPTLLAFAQLAAGIGAALGAAAGAIGMWLMNKMGQNAQGLMIVAAGAALTALGAKVAMDSGQAAEALKDGGPIGGAKAAAGASAAQNIPPSFKSGVVDPSRVAPT